MVVGKTLEQALMEVVEEDELRGIRQAKVRARTLPIALHAGVTARPPLCALCCQDEFHRKKQDEGRRVTELERREAARLAEKNKAVKAAQLRARRERDVRRKVASMHCARHLLGGLVHDAMAALEARGLFPDPLATEIEREFWPQVLEGAARHTNARANAQHAVDGACAPPLSPPPLWAAESSPACVAGQISCDTPWTGGPRRRRRRGRRAGPRRAGSASTCPQPRARTRPAWWGPSR